MQDVHIIAGPYGYLSQCEQMDTNCPTCGQFLQLQNFILELRLNLVDLSQKVIEKLNIKFRLRFIYHFILVGADYKKN